MFSWRYSSFLNCEYLGPLWSIRLSQKQKKNFERIMLYFRNSFFLSVVIEWNKPDLILSQSLIEALFGATIKELFGSIIKTLFGKMMKELFGTTSKELSGSNIEALFRTTIKELFGTMIKKLFGTTVNELFAATIREIFGTMMTELFETMIKKLSWLLELQTFSSFLIKNHFKYLIEKLVKLLVIILLMNIN